MDRVVVIGKFVFLICGLDKGVIKIEDDSYR